MAESLALLYQLSGVAGGRKTDVGAAFMTSTVAFCWRSRKPNVL